MKEKNLMFTVLAVAITGEVSIAQSKENIYKKGWIDFNKNGGGHFELESSGHFKLELGGQYHWNLQDRPTNFIGSCKRCC
jgi:hypothetical protein